MKNKKKINIRRNKKIPSNLTFSFRGRRPKFNVYERMYNTYMPNIDMYIFVRHHSIDNNIPYELINLIISKIKDTYDK